MPYSRCPICKERVFVDASTEMGDVVVCDECESDLELVGMDPIELDPTVSIPDDDSDDDFNFVDADD